MGVSINASTEGGMSNAPLRDLAAAPQTVKSSAATFYGFQCENTQGFDAWVQLFNKATPTPGVDSPFKEFRCPGNGPTRISFQPQGVKFDTAITVVATTTEKGGQGSAKGVHVFIDYA